MNLRILETIEGSLLKFESYTIMSIKLYSCCVPVTPVRILATIQFGYSVA